MTTESDPFRVRLFLVFAYEDRKFRETLVKHLRILERTGVIDSGHRYEVTPGSNLINEGNKRLNQADIVLLLITPDFIESDYCYDIQMARAMERHSAKDAHVIPILLRPIAQQNYLPIAHLQWLPQGKPRETKAVDLMDNEDEAYKEIIGEIKQVIENLPEQFIERRKEARRFWNSGTTPNGNSTIGIPEIKASAQGTRYFEYNIHTGWLGNVAWSPDGTRIASACKDGTVHVWQAI